MKSQIHKIINDKLEIAMETKLEKKKRLRGRLLPNTYRK